MAANELIRAGRIKHVKSGRKILMPRNEIEDFPGRETAINNAFRSQAEIKRVRSELQGTPG